MFDPNSFETELRDQTVTVEIGRCYPAHSGSDVEPPQAAECEVQVYGDSGHIELTHDKAAMIEAEAIDHLKWAAAEVELERRLSAMEAL